MSDAGVEVEVRRMRGVDVVYLAGEVDVYNAVAVTARVDAALADAAAVVLDLSRVPFLDSAGVRMVDGLAGDLRERSVPLRVVAPEAGAAAVVLRLVAFPPALLAGSVGEAVDALAG